MKWVQMKQDFITFMRRGTAQCNGSYRIALHSIYCINGILSWVSTVYRCRIAKTVFCHTILPSTSPLHKVFRQAYVSLRNFKCSSSDDFWQKMPKFHETFTQFQIKFSIFDNYWVFWKTFSSNMMIKSHFEQTYPDVSWHQYRWREKDRAGYANCACLPATLAKIIW